MSVNRRTLFRLGAGAVGAVAVNRALGTGQAAALGTTASEGAVLPAWAPLTASGPFDPVTGMYNWHAANTARTRQSLLDAVLTDQHHVFVGDSITAGWNSLNLALQGSANRDKSWPYYYRRELTRYLGLPEGGTGLVRAFDLVNPAGQSYFDARWTPGPNGVGIQPRGHYLSVTNSTVTFDSANVKFTPIAGTRVAVTYFDTNTFSVSVDGGTYVTVPGGNTGAVKRFEIGPLPYKAHKVSIKVGANLVLKLIGAEVLDGRGLSAHNVAQGGSGVTTANQKDWSMGGNPQLAMSPCFSSQTLYARTPSTVFIELGGNDLNANAGNLSRIRDGIEETAAFYSGSDIVLLGLAQGSEQFTDVDVRPLLTMLYRLADEHDWPLWDIQSWLGGYNQLVAKGYVGDAYGHLNAAGYELLGTTMARIAAEAEERVPPEPVGTGLTITTTTLPAALISKMYPSTTLKVVGGKSTYTWALASGSLPPGLKLSTSGVISGTPTSAGPSTFLVKVTDSSTPTKLTGVHRFTLTVAPMTVTTQTIPQGAIGRSYTSTTMKVLGGKSTYKWSVVEGTLPTGMVLSSGGTLSGTPSVAGTRRIVVQVADGSVPKLYATQAFDVVVRPLSVLTASLPNGVVKKLYPSTKMVADGGKSTLVWSVVAGALPPGVKMSSTGTFSGTPTTAGTYTATFQVADGSTPKNIATRELSIVVTG